MANAELFVFAPGMEENSFPKKQFKKWKISTTQVSAQSGGEKSRRPGPCEAGKECETLPPDQEEECSYAFRFLPALGGARGQDCAGKLRLPERPWFSGWAGPDPADAQRGPGACTSVIRLSLPTSCRGSQFHVLSHVTPAADEEVREKR